MPTFGASIVNRVVSAFRLKPFVVVRFLHRSRMSKPAAAAAASSPALASAAPAASTIAPSDAKQATATGSTFSLDRYLLSLCFFICFFLSFFFLQA